MSNSINKRVHPPKFKAQVVLELFKEQQTISQICSQFQVHSSQAHAWKKIALEGLASLFTNKQAKRDQEQAELIEELYKRIGEQQVALDWLKKKLGLIDSGKIRFN
jgi:putative transposase